MKLTHWYLSIPAALSLIALQLPLSAQNYQQQGNWNPQPQRNWNMPQGPMTGQANRFAGTTQPMQPDRQKRFNEIANLLELTPDQRSRVQIIMQQSWDQIQPLVPQLRQNRQALENAIRTSNPNQFNASVNQYAQREGQLISQMITIRSRALQQVYSNLNPAQRQKAADLFDLMLPRQMQGGSMAHGATGGTY